jgi:hypothetical protein
MESRRGLFQSRTASSRLPRQSTIRRPLLCAPDTVNACRGACTSPSPLHCVVNLMQRYPQPYSEEVGAAAARSDDAINPRPMVHSGHQ